MKPESTATRLRQLLKERNLKQIDIINLALPFCKKYDIKLGKNDLSQYVSGKVSPGQDKLYILSLALNVSEAWLMGFDVPRERVQEENHLMEKLNITADDELFSEFKSLYQRLTPSQKELVVAAMRDLTSPK